MYILHLIGHLINIEREGVDSKSIVVKYNIF